MVVAHLPPGTAGKEPDRDVEDGEEEAELVPLGLGHVASAVVWWRATNAVGGQAAHHVGELSERNGSEQRWGTHRLWTEIVGIRYVIDPSSLTSMWSVEQGERGGAVRTTDTERKAVYMAPMWAAPEAKR